MQDASLKHVFALELLYETILAKYSHDDELRRMVKEARNGASQEIQCAENKGYQEGFNKGRLEGWKA